MATFQTLEKIALSFPEVTVELHFEKISFRVKKKIFATYDEKTDRATVKLTAFEQNRFSSSHPNIFPVDNKWGNQGWTFVELDNVRQGLLTDVLKTAYCEVAPKELAEAVSAGKQ